MQIDHVVVDGSNIATEGRSEPSLKQLDEAVRAFLSANKIGRLSVVVDATFGHRIHKRERDEFDNAIANNELVTPPAGAVGRGDAFVLQIASLVDATVLSNDSFQEFQGEHDWLFDEGRLIGGKPVPEVGWIFVPRAPVRGPQGRRRANEAPAPAPATTAPPTDPPPRRSRARKAAPRETPNTAPSATATPSAPGGPRGNPQDVASRFAKRHRIGSQVRGVVEQFASHGAYVMVDDARCYVPLAAMGRPAPRSAKTVLARGEERSFVVDGIDHSSGEIDLAIPGFATAKLSRASDLIGDSGSAEPQEEYVAPAKRRATRKKSTARKATTKRKAPAKRKAAAKRKAPAKKATARKKVAAKKRPAKRKAAARKRPAKRKAAAKKRPAARKKAAKKRPAKRKAAAKKRPAKKKAAAKRKAPARRR